MRTEPPRQTGENSAVGSRTENKRRTNLLMRVGTSDISEKNQLAGAEQKTEDDEAHESRPPGTW
jgi:hypothetical protein